jgi:hypothetical protein
VQPASRSLATRSRVSTQAVVSRHNKEHLIGTLAFAKERLPASYVAGGHKRLQPVHIEIALRCLTHTLHQLQHLIQPNAVNRQQNRMED